MTITHTQATIIIALLAVIAFCAGTFLAQDWYYSFRAWRQQRAAEREEFERRYQAQLDWERKQRAGATQQQATRAAPACNICGMTAHVELSGQPRCDAHSFMPKTERTL